MKITVALPSRILIHNNNSRSPAAAIAATAKAIVRGNTKSAAEAIPRARNDSAMAEELNTFSG